MNCKICLANVTQDMLTASDLDNPDKAVYHESLGVVCLKHKGIKEIFEHLLEKADKALEDIGKAVY
jgi:hypothetical protein